MIVVSVGCPSGVGPEVSVAAAARLRTPCVLVGDRETILEAAALRGVAARRFADYEGTCRPGKIHVLQAGPRLKARDRRPGRPSQVAGQAQLAYVEAAYALVARERGSALVTGPVSKAAIVRGGAAHFRGHTEWLCELDGARHAVMCFHSSKLVTSLVTTHLPLAEVPRALSAQRVRLATVELIELLVATGRRRPRVAVASLNPHAGESELLGDEEARAIVPGLRAARRQAGARARIEGPVGAETAYRLCLSGRYDGVVAMYHDQATIPMKLVAFGDAVNVTQGLSVVRTSVDHGTAYDIAWRGEADVRGMLAAMRLAERLAEARSGRRGAARRRASW